ncbi:MAG TPA: hypothetical protein ENN21_05040 [Spirochaetes bacterium]|nr:hypothetical protein [Spirochaetota bacterium]
MDRNGQMTFSDDRNLLGINEAYQYIEEGNFSAAVEKVDLLLSANPDYPGLSDTYRTAKFWDNRDAEIRRLNRGKQTADFLMTQWEIFKKYAEEKRIDGSPSYKAAMRYIFFTASENYKIAFQEQESTTDNFDLLMNLGVCFLNLGEHKRTVETLEYARSSYRSNARLESLLAEAYFHLSEIPKSMLLFREAFFINPSEIDLSLLKSKPINELVKRVGEERPGCLDIREWIPIYGFLDDVFYVKRNLNTAQIETIKREIYTLEKNFQAMSPEKIAGTNILPRLINKYLWMLDYFEFQNYDFQSITEIRSRLLQIDRKLFEEHFSKDRKKK